MGKRNIYHRINIPLFHSLNFQLTGKGTEQDPFILFPEIPIRSLTVMEIHISDSKEHLVVDNVQVTGFKLESCENLILRHIKTNSLNLDNCTKCKIQDIAIEKELKILNSNDLSLENVEAGKTKISESKIENTSLMELKNLRSRTLVLDNCSRCKIQDSVIEKELKILNSNDLSFECVEAGSIKEVETQNTSRVNCKVTGWTLWGGYNL
ncbi:MAG: hypothetical protein JW891_08690 [Candidatus Lokiarchaeota archaeon]|nr:hypothetical protein [Candidatus Lokiarchaeota archaeon]